MTDDTTLLNNLLQQAPEDSLWLAGDNPPDFQPAAFAGSAISHRFDICQRLLEKGLHASFSDFELPVGKTFRHIIWRIAKEKAINLHLLNNAPQLLATGGRMHVIGYKNEGIDSLLRHLQQQNATVETIRHKKQLRQLVIEKPPAASIDNSYHQLQAINVDGLTFFSKPGAFGWNKTDAGSRLLVDELGKQLPPADSCVLDLGCGYGYLSIMARQMGIKHIDATDNNAAAIHACQANFERFAINGRIIADDCAASINASYDVILCNPPFHQGFAHDKQLVRRFSQQAARLLAPGGHAFFVVNRFIGLEKAAERLFADIRLLEEKQGFKVLLLTK